MIGPNNPPTTLVPKRWKINREINMKMTVPITRSLPGMKYLSKPFTMLRPSIADETDIGGVMIPSASSVPAPMMAGKTRFLPYLLTSA